MLSECASNVDTLDFSYNNISVFPSTIIYTMPALKYVYFQHNQLIEVPGYAFVNVSNLETIDFSYNSLRSLELWVLDIKQRADFSYNQISTITNQYFFNKFLNFAIHPSVSLINNSPTIDFTDALYEMYDQCSEVQLWHYEAGAGASIQPIFTSKLANINFGTSKINCSCDQKFLVSIIQLGSILNFGYPIENATCTVGSASSMFIDNPCYSDNSVQFSTVDFSRVYPRQCKINENETGIANNVSNFTRPTLNRVRYSKLKD